MHSSSVFSYISPLLLFELNSSWRLWLKLFNYSIEQLKSHFFKKFVAFYQKKHIHALQYAFKYCDGTAQAYIIVTFKSSFCMSISRSMMALDILLPGFSLIKIAHAQWNEHLRLTAGMYGTKTLYVTVKLRLWSSYGKT